MEKILAGFKNFTIFAVLFSYKHFQTMIFPGSGMNNHTVP